jgi:hypothetical protein
MSTLIFPPSLMNGEADQAQLNWPASGRVFQKNGHSDRRVSLRRSTDQGMGHSAKIWQAPKASVDKLGNGTAHRGPPHSNHVV